MHSTLTSVNYRQRAFFTAILFLTSQILLGGGSSEHTAMDGEQWYDGLVHVDSNPNFAISQFEEQFYSDDSIYAHLSLNSLLPLLLENREYKDIVSLTSNYLNRTRTIPTTCWDIEKIDKEIFPLHILENASRIYTHRYESLIQLDMAKKAYAEITELQELNPQFFHSANLPHGLLYYRALLSALVNDGDKFFADILPYIIISNARSGHEQIFTILQSTPSDPQNTSLSLLNAKVHILNGDFKLALEMLIPLIDEFTDDLLELTPRRPKEGIFYDLFRSAQFTPEYRQEVINIFLRFRNYFSRLSGRLVHFAIPNHESSAIFATQAQIYQLEARLSEYAARLLLLEGDYNTADSIFASAFTKLRNYRERESYSLNDLQADAEVLVELSHYQELLLWYWAQASFEESQIQRTGNARENRKTFPALSFLRNADFFSDVSEEYLSMLLRAGEFERISDFLASYKLAPSTEGLMKKVLSAFGVASRNFAYSSSFLSQSLDSKNPVVNEDTIRELFPLTRSISYADSGIEVQGGASSLQGISGNGTTNVLAERQGIDNCEEILQGFAKKGLYTQAAEFLNSLPAWYRESAELVVEMVGTAYDESEWYGGLRLLEVAIGRSFIFSDGPFELGQAALARQLPLRKNPRSSNSESENANIALLQLLYPLAWLETVEKNIDLDSKEPSKFENQSIDLNPFYVIALMREESRFDPMAGSHAGAIGLGQIIPETAEEIAQNMRLENYDLFDPNDNIAMTMFYLNFLSQRFSTIWEVLSAYNAGPGRVRTWNRELLRSGLPGFVYLFHVPFRETRGYIRRVVESFIIYDYLYCKIAVRDTVFEYCNSKALNQYISRNSTHSNTRNSYYRIIQNSISQ